VHHLIAESPGGAWSVGGAILTFVFPMLLFIAVAAALYILYTKPEVVPGHQVPSRERPVSYTAVPGAPADAGVAARTEGGAATVTSAAGPAGTSTGETEMTRADQTAVTSTDEPAGTGDGA
jgi:hypothetical protein